MALKDEMTRAALQSAVIRRAWESVQFKQKLLSQPKEALKEIGFTLHKDVEVTVIQEHKKKLVLVLPESPLTEGQEYIAGSGIPSQQPPPQSVFTFCGSCGHTFMCETPPQQPLPGQEPLPGEEEPPSTPPPATNHPNLC